MGAEFFQTVMGHTFYEGTMPRIAESLESLAVEFKRANDLKEKELALQTETPDPTVSDIARGITGKS